MGYAISIKLTTTVGHFLYGLDFENVYVSGPACFFYPLMYIAAITFVVISNFVMTPALNKAEVHYRLHSIVRRLTSKK